MVSWADRIAYVCHDWEDAVRAGIVSPAQLPPAVRSLCGERRSQQLGAFIAGVVSATLRTGQVGMEEEAAEALAAFRSCNYERIYLRRRLAAPGRGGRRACCGPWSSTSPTGRTSSAITTSPPPSAGVDVLAGSPEAVRAAVTYVAGMTDRFAFRQAVAAPRLGPGQAARRRRRLSTGGRPRRVGRQHHWFPNDGGRFSVNAATPSAKSAPRIISAMRAPASRTDDATSPCRSR